MSRRNYYEIRVADRRAATSRARGMGLEMAEKGWVDVGTLHTHPGGLLEAPEIGAEPSVEDRSIAKLYVPKNEVRAVYHPRTGTLTAFNYRGIMGTFQIGRAWWTPTRSDKWKGHKKTYDLERRGAQPKAGEE